MKWRWMSMRRNNEAWSIPEISVLSQPRWIQTKEEKNNAKDELNFLRKKSLEDQRQVSLMWAMKRRNDVIEP